jgi:hypothetical protein
MMLAFPSIRAVTVDGPDSEAKTRTCSRLSGVLATGNWREADMNEAAAAADASACC